MSIFKSTIDALRAMAPAKSQRAVTPNDNSNLPGGTCRALEVITSGNLVTIAEDDADNAAITRTGVVAGQILNVRVRRVKATGTTATVVALY